MKYNKNMYIKSMMKYIAENMSEISHELSGENVSGEDILEVYKMEMDLLAQEVGLSGHLPLLGEYLSLIEEILGEEEMISLFWLHFIMNGEDWRGEESKTSLGKSELINLLKVICAIKLGE